MMARAQIGLVLPRFVCRAGVLIPLLKCMDSDAGSTRAGDVAPSIDELLDAIDELERSEDAFGAVLLGVFVEACFAVVDYSRRHLQARSSSSGRDGAS